MNTKYNTLQLSAPIPEESAAPEKLTLFSIFWQKFLCWLRDSKIKTLLFAVYEAFFVLGVAAVLISPKGALAFLFSGIAAKSFALPKIICAVLIVKHRRAIISRIRAWRSGTFRETSSVEGIATEELVHFIIKNGHFKVIPFCSKFGVSKRVHERIARQLEKLGILDRDENNGRVVRPGVLAQEIARVLQSGESAEALSSFRIVRGERDPETLPEVREALQNFTVRPVS